MKKFLVLLTLLEVCFSSFAAQDRPTVAVVLSGGGAKGIAHIALLEKLEELGIPVDMVMGTSMGSLIGGLYSAGYSPKDIRNLIEENSLSQLFNVLESKGYKSLIEPFEYKSEALTIGLGKGILTVSGILDDYKIMNFFLNAVGNVPDSIDFDDLPIPFRCIATNAITGEAKVFENGNLIDAMRASMSIPFAFSPKEVDGQLYVDGGLVNNMPIELAKEMGYDIIIAEDVNAKFEVTSDLYESISGAVGAVFRVIVNNTINDQKQYADLILEPDLTGLGIFSFDTPDVIIERGSKEVQEKLGSLEEIASRFTEEQKEYKDSTRQGDYFTEFAKRTHESATSLASKSSEKAYEQTRISTQLKINSNLRHDFKDGYPYEFMITPGFETKLYIKDLGDSNFSLDSKLQLGSPCFFDTTLLYKMYEKKNSLYAFANGVLEFGSISQATDKNIYGASTTAKKIETKTEFNLGLKLTDETTHNMNLYASASAYFMKSRIVLNDYMSDIMGDHYFVTFYPSITASYVWYGNSENTNFDLDGTRFDFIGRVGYLGTNLTYKLGVGFEFEIPVGEKSGFWFDATAFTTREADELCDTYIEYGGWDGMPGYSYNDKFRDYVYGGIGYQIELGEGLVSEYLQIEVRAGYRESVSGYSDICDYERNLKPFHYMTEYRKFDLGIGIGYGFKSFLGEALVGVGITKDKNYAIYFNAM